MKRTPPAVLLFHKPFGVLSQFSEGPHPGRHPTLASFGPFPDDVYPAGRLDADSEGLLLLTNSALLKHRLLTPRYHHPRTYLAQVERIPDEYSLRRLADGSLALDGRKVLPATVRLLADDPGLPPRSVPVRFRKTVPTTWLEITLTEGRNRQVRRMTAAVGHPTLRLVRTRIASLTLKGIEEGKWRALTETETARFMEEMLNSGYGLPLTGGGSAG
jgi:23S rRNA pseudouridine2457 synthase